MGLNDIFLRNQIIAPPIFSLAITFQVLLGDIYCVEINSQMQSVSCGFWEIQSSNFDIVHQDRVSQLEREDKKKKSRKGNEGRPYRGFELRIVLVVSEQVADSLVTSLRLRFGENLVSHL